MREQSSISGPMLGVIAAVAVAIGGAVWWFSQPDVKAETKPAVAELPAKTIAPRPATAATAVPSPAARVAAPVAAPAVVQPNAAPATAVALAVPAVPENPESRAELQTTVPLAVRLLESGDFVGFVQKFAPPQVLARPGVTAEQLAQRFDGTADGAQLLQALHMIEGQTPAYDATGDKASYELNPPVGNHKTLDFIKIDGEWKLGG